jgi:hypothetical protein
MPIKHHELETDSLIGMIIDKTTKTSTIAVFGRALLAGTIQAFT